MRYRLLGNSGLRVSEAALGTMTFGDDWGWGAALAWLRYRPVPVIPIIGSRPARVRRLLLLPRRFRRQA
jgi:aryl-alcohol dehydrogenase-like predicted oxidoreductase